MSASTKVPGAAWEFMKALASAESLRKLIVDPVRSLPPRKSLMQAWATRIAQAGQPAQALRIGQQVIDYGRAVPLPGFPFHSIIGKYRDALVQGRMSPQEAALRIHQDFEVELQRLRAK